MEAMGVPTHRARSPPEVAGRRGQLIGTAHAGVDRSFGRIRCQIGPNVVEVGVTGPFELSGSDGRP